MSVVDESIHGGKVSSTPIFSGRSLAHSFMKKIIGEQKTKLNTATSYQPSAKNKCGPGQPPGPHWFGALFCDPCPRTRHGGVHLSCAPKSACYDALGKSPAKQALQVEFATPRWPTASPAMCGGLVRRPQRPGNQARAEARSWRNPPSHSPSRIAGHRRLCRNALAGHTEHLARCQHFALATRSHQAKTRAPLCRNCGCRRFLVEARGKSGPSLF